MADFKIEKIKWRDLLTISERVPLSDATNENFATIDLVGFNVKEDDDVIYLAHMVCNIPNFKEPVIDNFSIVPKSSIISRKELK